MKLHNNIKGSALLCLAALLWGLAFVAQSQAADSVPPFIFNALRSFIGSLFLLLLLLIGKIRTGKPIFPTGRPKQKEMLIGGGLCGTLLAISVNFQQFGLSNYPAGAASEARGGFLTALYVVIVPIISVFIGKKIKAPMWVAVAVATVGIYLLSLSGGIDSIYLGDVLMFVCAISFSVHILAVDRYGDPVGGMLLSMLQFLVCGILSGVLSLCFETVNWACVLDAAPQILYLGIVSSGIAYTLQIYGQKFAEPAVASLSMSLESVFAALGGWLISGNTLTLREFFGCALVFVAIILAQIPQFFEKKRKKSTETAE
ncbi:MAG: DMT family transporter [Clostridia bacterium]|nr:DMT family transporter [Clostridia bacterium]